MSSYQNRRLLLNVYSHTLRSFSSKPRPAHLRQYLDAWMGNSGVPMVVGGNGLDPRISTTGAGNALTVAGKSYLVPTLRLPKGISPADLSEGLKVTTSLNAGYFHSAPIVVDLIEWNPVRSGAPAGPILEAGLLQTFITALRDAGLHPVGVSNVSSPDLKGAALALGIPCFMGRHSITPAPMQQQQEQPSQQEAAAAAAPSSSTPPSTSSSSSSLPESSSETLSRSSTSPPSSPERESLPSPSYSSSSASIPQQAKAPSVEEEDEMTSLSAAAAAAVEPLPTKVIKGSVRTGQQVIAEGASLVVLGSVNSGAEVSADGDIHIYGKLTGRALAGLSGNTKAKIFATRFNAELVAIADCFTTCDQPADLQGIKANAATCVSLDDEGRDLRFHAF